jgi:hypothetical protein
MHQRSKLPYRQQCTSTNILESENAHRAMSDLAATLRANGQHPRGVTSFQAAVELLMSQAKVPTKTTRSHGGNQNGR